MKPAEALRKAGADEVWEDYEKAGKLFPKEG